jgi:hypothetical protein
VATEPDGASDGIHVHGVETDLSISAASVSRILDSIDNFISQLLYHPYYAAFLGFFIILVITLIARHLRVKLRLRHELEIHKLRITYQPELPFDNGERHIHANEKPPAIGRGDGDVIDKAHRDV